MKANLPELIKTLVQFQGVERHIPIPNLSRLENDTEHSYNLTMAAWLIIVQDQLPLDLNLALKYSLVHDLVEVYAGDAHALDPTIAQIKADREQAALIQLTNQQNTREFADYIQRYEKQADEESKFVYSLDKLMPVFMILDGHVPIWKEYGLTQVAWEESFRAKIEKSKYLIPYLDQVIMEQKRHPELFTVSTPED